MDIRLKGFKKHAHAQQDAAINAAPFNSDAKNSQSSSDGASAGDNKTSQPERALSCAKNRLLGKNKYRSFLALLIRVFLTFTVITIISVSIIFTLANWAGNSDKINISLKDIPSYESELKQGKYQSIPLERTLGKEGWLDIVDSDGNIVYSSRGATGYTVGELDCVLKYGSGESVRSIAFQGANDEYNYMLIRTYGDGSEQYLLLDNELRIITGNMSTTKSQFSQEEFELLTFNASHSDMSMHKFAFEDDNGNSYIAIFLDANIGDGVTPYVFLGVSAVGLAILIITLLIFFIRYINKHVQRPIKALGAAMNQFAGGGYLKESKLSYQGSVDFEELIDSFNEMVSLLNASEKQRKALEEDKQRMLAGLSHDLKTPITVIQGFSKAIRDGVVAEEDKQKYLDLIISKTENMGELINEFYEYSKLDHPDFALERKPTDVAELARACLADRYDEFDINGCELIADITEDRLIANVDAPQLKRVFENLVNNFFKYTQKGSMLKFSVEKQEDFALITVADNGDGIRPEARADIFKPFVVGEQSRNKQGSGLGLAVCQKIIEAHNGSISLSDAPQEGFTTQFDILLPLAETPAAEEPEAPSKPAKRKQ